MKSNKKSKSARRAPARRPDSGRLSKTIFAAPSAVDRVVTPYLTFSGSASGGCRIRSFTALSTVNAASGGQGQLPGFYNTVYSASSGSITPNQPLTTIILHPAVPIGIYCPSGTTWSSYHMVYDGLSMQNLASNFARYRVIRARLVYVPASGTANDRSYSLGFSSDPYSGIVGATAYYTGGTPTANSPPTYSSCKSVMCSRVFAKWMPWDLALPVDPSANFYVKCNVSPLVGATSASNVPISDENRLNFWGALSLNASDGTPTPVGEMYLDAEYEFWDFSPINASIFIAPSPARVMRVEEKKEDDGQKLMDCGDDLEVIPPPTFRPAPSSMPGTPAYRPITTPPNSPAPPYAVSRAK